MKTERLYAITIFLLNHGKTSASELAKKFEVSVRTIQRDIDSLCRAGVPVVSEMGAAGGYCLTDSFKMDAQLATDEEFADILTALKGFSTAINNTQVDKIVEKIASLTKEKENSVILDFSVLKEIDNVLITRIQEAIKKEKSGEIWLYKCRKCISNPYRRTYCRSISMVCVVFTCIFKCKKRL